MDGVLLPCPMTSSTTKTDWNIEGHGVNTLSDDSSTTKTDWNIEGHGVNTLSDDFLYH